VAHQQKLVNFIQPVLFAADHELVENAFRPTVDHREEIRTSENLFANIPLVFDPQQASLESMKEHG
jgi:hypothetical protein